MHRHEAGFSYIELTVVAILSLLVVLVMMPSLSGYMQYNPATGTVTGIAGERALAEQIVEMARQAELDALSQGQTMQWSVCGDCGTNYIKFTEPNGQTISQVIFDPGLHVTQTCYRGYIQPQGAFLWANPPCGSTPATFEVICFDSNTPANPFGIKITVVAATGQVISTVVGKCN